MVDSKSAADAPQLRALRTVARQLQFSEEFALDLYQQELQGLREQAKLDRFVPVLAEKRARRALKKMKR